MLSDGAFTCQKHKGGRVHKVLNIPCRMQPILEDIVCIWTIVASNACALLHDDEEVSMQVLSVSQCPPALGTSWCMQSKLFVSIQCGYKAC